MNKILLLACAAILMLVAGCTTPSPDNVTSQPTSPFPTTTVTSVANPVLPMDAEVIFGTGDKQFTAWIDSFEIDPPSEPGKRDHHHLRGGKKPGTKPVPAGLVQQADGRYGQNLRGDRDITRGKRCTVRPDYTKYN